MSYQMLMSQDYSYCASSSLKELKVTLKITQLIDECKVLFEGQQPELFFQVSFRNSAGDVQSKYSRIASRSLVDETVSFGVSYRDASYDSLFGIAVWSMGHSETTPLASTTVSLFSHNLTLRTGNHHLVLWPNRFPDLNLPSSTPGLVDD
jgi:hypothetical protein